MFEHIRKIKPFRDRYRELLDGVVLRADEHERVVREGVAARSCVSEPVHRWWHRDR